MAALQSSGFDAFERRSPLQAVGAAWPYLVVLLVLGGLAWFAYQQLNAVRGVKVEAPSPQVVSMLPPPPPPPPPPPEPKEVPPEPTEQPQPSPVEAPKTPQPQPQAAPVSIAAPAQAGADSYGIAAGSGGGIGAPGGRGTCLGTNCGGGGGGGGVSEGVYRRYLSSALQERVQADERISRLVFAADFTLTITREGRVAGVQFVGARGRDDDESMKRLAGILASIRGLDPPPEDMRFPQRITVRGRRAF